MHPSEALIGTKSEKLAGRRIVLGVTGSIAAVETVKLSRELLRHGAEVQAVMTEAACKILHPDALEFATGKKPVTELSGAVEHVSWCGDVQDKADLLLIAPATANTISKIAAGIDDSPVTTFATTALGTDIPIMIIPAMHSSMYDNPIVKKNIDKLEELGGAVEFVEPRFEENKAKIADLSTIVARVIRKLGMADLADKRVLVVAGSTAEPVDEFRLLTNRSTGRMGIELALNAYERGADVTLWYGRSPVEPPSYILTEDFEKIDDLYNKMNFLDFDITVVCAAISDYTPEKHKGKISSGAPDLTLSLKPTPKVLTALRQADPVTFLVGFKAEYDLPEHELVDKAFDRLEKLELNMIVANDLKDVHPDRSHVIILKQNRARREVEGTKSEIAGIIFDEILLELSAADFVQIDRN